MAVKRRIVFVGPMHPYRGGIAHFLETMFWGLEARGHEVYAVTFTRQYPESLFPGKTQLETEAVDRPVPSRRLIDTLSPLSWFRASRHIRSLNPDVILFKYWMPFFAPAFGTIARKARKRGTKVVVVVDNAIPHERRPGDLLLGRYLLKAADGFIIMSDAVRHDLQTLRVEAPSRLIKHPIYDHFGQAIPRVEARRLLRIPDESPTLLFFGFVRKYKGLHVLLESMARVLESLPEARLLVAGEFYDDRAPYLSLIREHGLEHAVHLHTDYVPNSEVAQYFCAADVVVQPYVSATQSGVVQIAFHFDKPAIVTDVGGLAEVVRHEETGLVVPPENPVKLADAIVRFFEEEMTDVLTAGVRREKPKYSWDRLYEAVEELAIDDPASASGKPVRP